MTPQQLKQTLTEFTCPDTYIPRPSEDYESEMRFRAAIATGPIHWIFGDHVPGSKDSQVMKSILRHEGLNRRSISTTI